MPKRKLRVVRLKDLPPDVLANLTPKGRKWRLGRAVWDLDMYLEARRALGLAIHYSPDDDGLPWCNQVGADICVGPGRASAVSCPRCQRAMRSAAVKLPAPLKVPVQCATGSVMDCRHCLSVVRGLRLSPE